MPKLSEFKNTLAIAMWDFTYLEKHVKGGVFEDFEKTVDELVERGYNAVRIDAFPHLIAKDIYGNNQDTFIKRAGTGGIHRLGFSVWGREWTIEVNPRQSLVEMIKICQRKGVWVGLSTWLFEVEEQRSVQVQGSGELVRIWDETLEFLKENDCLNNIIYVDILNEYPLWNDFTWMHKSLENLKYPVDPNSEFNNKQQQFYWDCINDVIKTLHTKWKQFDILTCQTENHWSYVDKDKDYSNFDALDVHIWMVHNNEFANESKNFEVFHSFSDDFEWRKQYPIMRNYWNQNITELTQWMDGKMGMVSQTGQKWNIPFGNTEGWGIIMWCDHPYLDWQIIKQSGEICAELGAKHGYAFNCTSNFTHPNFKLWDDIEWHQKVTKMIRDGENAIYANK